MIDAAGKRKRRGVKAEINVTPLVDVVFVLLIVFMVVAPLVSGGKAVALPSIAGSLMQPHAVHGASFVVSLTADKRLWIDAQSITQGRLSAEIQRRLQAHPEAEVLLEADRSLSVRDVRPALAALRAFGAQRVRLAVAERGPERLSEEPGDPRAR